METRTLGRGDLTLSVLGLGTWAFGGDGWAGSWGPQDAGECGRTVRAAVDAGVNWIDTAPAYGLGRSESIVGDALAGVSAPVHVATKCGERIGADGTYRSGEPAGIVADCEASLRRLRRDVIDLYQLHHPPPDVPIEAAWEAMAGLVAAGKVRHLGLCNVGVDELARCEKIHPVASLQGPYSPLRRKLEPEVLPFCLEAGIGVLPFGARGHGFLTDGFDRGRLAADDWRRKDRWDDEIGRGRDLVAKLRPVAERAGATVGQLTTAWVTDHPAVTATPVGTRSVGQARENFGGPVIVGARRLVADAVPELR